MSEVFNPSTVKRAADFLKKQTGSGLAVDGVAAVYEQDTLEINWCRFSRCYRTVGE